MSFLIYVIVILSTIPLHAQEGMLKIFNSPSTDKDVFVMTFADGEKQTIKGPLSIKPLQRDIQARSVSSYTLNFYDKNGLQTREVDQEMFTSRVTYLGKDGKEYPLSGITKKDSSPVIPIAQSQQTDSKNCTLDVEISLAQTPLRGMIVKGKKSASELDAKAFNDNDGMLSLMLGVMSIEQNAGNKMILDKKTKELFQLSLEQFVEGMKSHIEETDKNAAKREADIKNDLLRAKPAQKVAFQNELNEFKIHKRDWDNKKTAILNTNIEANSLSDRLNNSDLTDSVKINQIRKFTEKQLSLNKFGYNTLNEQLQKKSESGELVETTWPLCGDTEGLTRRSALILKSSFIQDDVLCSSFRNQPILGECSSYKVPSDLFKFDKEVTGATQKRKLTIEEAAKQ